MYNAEDFDTESRKYLSTTPEKCRRTTLRNADLYI